MAYGWRSADSTLCGPLPDYILSLSLGQTHWHLVCEPIVASLHTMAADNPLYIPIDTVVD
jgi:hypothetical protein